MKNKPAFFILVISVVSILTGFDSIDRIKSVEGTWIRKEDNLMVKIENANGSIVKEGNEKFPCDVSGLPIYKDIVKVQDNRWTCQFLVVTMGSCKKEYQSGEMFISRESELVIICPGFASKIYSKVKPRYEGSQN